MLTVGHLVARDGRTRVGPFGPRAVAWAVGCVYLVSEPAPNPPEDCVHRVALVQVLDGSQEVADLGFRRHPPVVFFARLRVSFRRGGVGVREPLKISDEHHRSLPELHEREALTRNRVTELPRGHA